MPGGVKMGAVTVNGDFTRAAPKVRLGSGMISAGIVGRDSELTEVARFIERVLRE
jgi:hypothetical protein